MSTGRGRTKCIKLVNIFKLVYDLDNTQQVRKGKRENVQKQQQQQQGVIVVEARRGRNNNENREGRYGNISHKRVVNIKQHREDVDNMKDKQAT